jgi:hypothetical protein
LALGGWFWFEIFVQLQNLSPADYWDVSYFDESAKLPMLDVGIKRTAQQRRTALKRIEMLLKFSLVFRA